MVNWSEQLLRSMLFAPGNHPRKVAKVDSFGADAIVLDLEDAVAQEEKMGARTAVRTALGTFRNGVRIVRVNSLATGLCLADLDTVVCPQLDAVILPKVESPETLAQVDRHIAGLEAREGVEAGTIRLLPLIETAAGVARVEEIAREAPRRVYTLVFGQGDFTNDLGIDMTADATEILYARSRIVVAARAAGMAQALDGPFVDLSNPEGLFQDCLRARQLGYQGRIVVYPPQVETVHRAYSLVRPEEVEMARKVIAAFELAESAGSASIQVEGRFVDYPIYRRALHKIRLYAASQSLTGEGTGR